MDPTNALYQSLQQAYGFFNEALFKNKLPPIIFTVQRKKGVMGYFAPDRWSSIDGKFCHEIAINPAHIGQSRVIEVMQTLVHEMVHCWQYCYGEPGRNCYHNKEWAHKMMDLGLQPSSTGKPGGSIVGQHMSDYPTEDGMFLKACLDLVENHNFQIPWIDRLVTPFEFSPENLGSYSDTKTLALENHNTAAELNSLLEHQEFSETTKPAAETFLHATYEQLLPKETFIQVAAPQKNKIKYHCDCCGLNVWGKPSIRLLCVDCDKMLSPCK